MSNRCNFKKDGNRTTTYLANSYYNDIHEENFIVDREGIVHGIDIDSCGIFDNKPLMELYPSLLSQNNSTINKYQKSKVSCVQAADIIPSKDLDIYSYIRIIINFMFEKPLYELSLDRLQNYLDYLEFHGGNLEFLYCLSRIYDIVLKTLIQITY